MKTTNHNALAASAGRAATSEAARRDTLVPGVAYAILLIRQLAQTMPDKQRKAQTNFVADYVEREVAKF